MNTNPSISLVFVNYHSVQYLTKALESLFSLEQEKDLFEVIIVNNDASESTDLLRLRQKYPLMLVESDGNVGFGRGNNMGAKQARGALIGFMNPDTLWVKPCLRKIQERFAARKEIGVLGMVMQGSQGDEERWSAGEEPSFRNLFWNNFSPTTGAYWGKEKLSFPDYVSGGALFVRKDLFSQIGGFDEQFFLYFEDVDLCKRVRDNGFAVVRDTAYPIVHLGGKSVVSRRAQKKYFYASQLQYFKKHRPVWESKLLEMLQFFFCRTML